MILKIEDLRVKQFSSKSGTLFVFCVDASGSMAQNRMRETKGAVIKLLQSAYINRDKVAMVVFRKDEAEIVLNQTGSIEKAKRELEILPTGGGTPLADGLYKSLEIALKAKKINLQSCLLYTSDAADERSSVDLGGRRIIKKKKNISHVVTSHHYYKNSIHIQITDLAYNRKA